MPHTSNGAHPTARLSVRDQLSSAWLFIVLTIIFRDLHEFVRPGFIDGISDGTFNGMALTEELMLYGALLVTMLVGMVFLSRILPRQVNRIANVVAAVVQAALIAPNLRNDLDDIYFASLQLMVLGFVLWTVIRWRA